MSSYLFLLRICCCNLECLFLISYGSACLYEYICILIMCVPNIHHHSFSGKNIL